VMDDRPREDWRRTPWALRALGFPGWFRRVFAHAGAGGGWDETEWRRADPKSST